MYRDASLSFEQIERDWTASHVLQLKSGCNSLNPAGGKPSGWGPVGFAGPYTDAQRREMLACWAACGDEIMEDYQARRPGQRPWFWWQLRGVGDLPEDERRALTEIDELQGWD